MTESCLVVPSTDIEMGAAPISPVVETLGIPAAKVPTENIDSNQNSPVKNIRLGCFVEGIAILTPALVQTPR